MKVILGALTTTGLQPLKVELLRPSPATLVLLRGTALQYVPSPWMSPRSPGCGLNMNPGSGRKGGAVLGLGNWRGRVEDLCSLPLIPRLTRAHTHIHPHSTREHTCAIHTRHVRAPALARLCTSRWHLSPPDILLLMYVPCSQ